MGAARKIQSEIDRTLKRVQEGIDIFDEIWDKVYAPETSLNQKEKYEGDLKKEIKKLQRYRDQIKVWMSSSDVKDKGDLMAGRKSIEREMERFKLCEKEMKTKAFSKEGLGQSAKLDPREQARAEIRDWLNSTVDNLNQQIDQFESEVESLQTSGKRKAKPPPKLAHFEELLCRHRQHVLRLEQMLRLLDNEGLTVEDVTETRDMVDDYMERHEDDFEEFGNPDDTYEDILDRLDGVTETQVSVVHATTVAAVPKDREKEKEKERERAAAAAAKAQLAAHGQIRLEEDDKKAAPLLARQSTSGSGRPTSASINVPSHPPAASTDTASAARELISPKSVHSVGIGSSPIRGSRAAQPQTQQQQQTQPQRQASTPRHVSQKQLKQQQQHSSATTNTQLPDSSPPTQLLQQAPRPIQGFVMSGGGPVDAGASERSSSSLPQQSADSSGWPLPTPSEGTGSTGMPLTSATERETLPDSKQRFLSQLQQIQANGPGAALDSQQLPDSTPVSPQTSSRQAPPASSARPSFDGTVASDMASDSIPQQQQQQQADQVETLSNELRHQTDGGDGSSDTIQHVAGSTLRALPPHADPAASLQSLKAAAYVATPECTDRDWKPTSSRPRLPTQALPPSYPQQKLPILGNRALFEKLDSEALFFSFYYQPGSYQQSLAAKELRRQSWRYHKQHGAWFQRHEEPSDATDEYEKGTYVYFDYNIMHDDSQSGWCYRLKQNFTFRYDALEDESIS